MMYHKLQGVIKMRKFTPYFRFLPITYSPGKTYKQYVVTISVDMVKGPKFPLRQGKVKIKINGRRLIISQ